MQVGQPRLTEYDQDIFISAGLSNINESEADGSCNLAESLSMKGQTARFVPTLSLLNFSTRIRVFVA